MEGPQALSGSKSAPSQPQERSLEPAIASTAVNNIGNLSGKDAHPHGNATSLYDADREQLAIPLFDVRDSNGADWSTVDVDTILKPREKRTIDFRGKLYLAPLTTVGNLPFRRVDVMTWGRLSLLSFSFASISSELMG